MPLPGGSAAGASGSVPLPGAASSGEASADADPFAAYDAFGATPHFGGLDLSDPFTTTPPRPAVDELDFGEAEGAAGGRGVTASRATDPFGADVGAFEAPGISSPGLSAESLFADDDLPPPPPSTIDFDLSQPLHSAAGTAEYELGGKDLDERSHFAASSPPSERTDGFGFDGAASMEAGGLDPLDLPPLVDAPSQQVEDDVLEFLRDPPTGTVLPPAAAPPPPPASGAQDPPPPVFHLRRSNGKRIGPFDHETILRLLRQDQVDGSEEFSEDAEEWFSLRDLPDVATILQSRRVAQPRAAPPVVGPVLQRGVVVQTEEENVSADGVDAGKASAGVGLGRKLSAGLGPIPPRIALMAGGGVAAAVGLAVVASLVFGGGAEVQVAAAKGGAISEGAVRQIHAELLRDNLASGQKALALASALVKDHPDDPLAQALEARAAFTLNRRHGAAGGAAAVARQRLAGLDAAQRQRPEWRKAAVAAGFLDGNTGVDRSWLIEQSKAHPRDLDLLSLLGEGALLSDDSGSARTWFSRLQAEDPRSPLALHALGVLRLREGGGAAAAQLFEEALEAEPLHAISAVELARIALAGGDVADAKRQLARAMSEQAMPGLGNPERIVAGLLQAEIELHERAPAAAEDALRRALALDAASVDARLALGRFLLERHRSQDAAEILAAEPTADRPELIRLLVKAYLMEGKAAQAETRVEALAKKAPKSDLLPELRGLILSASGKAEEAIASFEIAATQAPESLEPLLALGWAQLHAGYRPQLAATIERMEALIASAASAKEASASIDGEAADAPAGGEAHAEAGATPEGGEGVVAAKVDAGAGATPGGGEGSVAARAGAGAGPAAGEKEAKRGVAQREAISPLLRAELQRLVGELRLADGDAAGALKAFGSAVALAPTDSLPLVGKGRALLALAQVDEAAAVLEDSIALNDSSTQALRALGTLQWEQGKREQAIETLGKAAAIAPADTSLLLRLAAAQADAERWDAALLSAEAALGRDDRLAEAHFQRARSLLGRGDAKGAESAIRRAISLEKDDPRWQLQLGRIYESSGAMAQALDAYRKTTALQPSNVDALEGAGRMLLALGGHAEAVKSLEAALALDPGRTHLLEAIADGYLKSRNYKKAIGAIERAQAGGAKGLSFKLARAYQEQGKTNEAITFLQRSIKEDPDEANAFRYLGYALKEKNRIREAIGAFRTYLEKSPAAEDKAEIEDEIAVLQL